MLQTTLFSPFSNWKNNYAIDKAKISELNLSLMKKKTALKTSSCYSDANFNRLPVVLGLFVAFIILALTLVSVLDYQKTLTDVAKANQLKVIQNNIR